MNANDFLSPYRGQRFHLQEWGGLSNRSRSADDYFSMKDSKARNVIECLFGILKMRWVMMQGTFWYSQRMVGLFFTTCCLLHNFISAEGGPDIFDKTYVPPTTDETPYVETMDDAPNYVEASRGRTQSRHTLAQQMCAMRRPS
ncbi:hypothetical protein LINPERPRIM_LOCUS6095 [Linum perenne]